MLFYNHMNITINKCHSYCRLRLGRHKMMENSMEVRSNCAFHIITKITPTRMKDLCQGRGGKALTPSIVTSKAGEGHREVAEGRGPSSWTL